MVRQKHQQRFVKAVKNIQITRRMTRGFRNIDYFIAMIYLCNCKLEISFTEVVAVPIIKQAIGFVMQSILSQTPTSYNNSGLPGLV